MPEGEKDQSMKYSQFLSGEIMVYRIKKKKMEKDYIGNKGV